VTAGPADTSPFQLPPEFYDQEPTGGGGPNPGQDKRNKLLLQGLGLVGVAVLSGLLFWAVQPAHVAGVAEAATSQVDSAGKYTFSRVLGPASDTNCAQHAYSGTATFFQSHPCKELTRSLYTTTMPSGAQVMVSVALVEMPSPGDATALQVLTKKDGTGNVSDLITDGAQVPNGPSAQEMKDGGFASAVNGARAVIVLSAFAGGHQDLATLREVSQDALRLGGK
jgi:hypothetical protein